MPIVDKELVNDKPMEEMKTPNQSIGDYLMGAVQNNMSRFGDSEWMVRPF